MVFTSADRIIFKIGVATGQHSFVHEQSQLIGDQSREYASSLCHISLSRFDDLL